MAVAGEYIRGVSVACQPDRGWVTVAGQLAEGLEYPVVELAILSAQGEKLAQTMIVDAPAEFQMTLHLQDTAAGAELVLRVEVLQGERTAAVREYRFDYSPE